MNTTAGVFGKKKRSKKPLIGFEPMTYALPWRYSTTELKGPYLIQFLNKKLATMSLVYIFVTAYTYYIDKIGLKYMYIDRFYSDSLRNNKSDLPSE